MPANTRVRAASATTGYARSPMGGGNKSPATGGLSLFWLGGR